MIEKDEDMHECPNCGQACDCIGDDTWDDSKLAAKLERILDRRGVTIEEETDTSVPSVRKKAPRKGRKALPTGDAKQSRTAGKGRKSRDATT